MPTGTTNNKSQQKTARIPLEVLSEMNLVKEESETDAQFIVTAMRGEIKRRQRRRKQEMQEG